MIYLDTHVVVWLYAGLTNKFSETAGALINDHELFISPIVRLELAYLHEIERVTADSDAIIADLSQRIGLQVCDKNFNSVVNLALAMSWTRDPFDRLIVANAAVHDDILLSKDINILTQYTFARW